MTEVGAADLSRLLQTKRNECSSIVTSRKRKLRELFAVATQSEGLPHPVLTNPDAPTTTPAEWQFLQANDIIQGKTLNEASIPTRPTISLELFKKSLAKAILNAPEPTPKQTLEDASKPDITNAQDKEQANGTHLPLKVDDALSQRTPSPPASTEPAATDKAGSLPTPTSQPIPSSDDAVVEPTSATSPVAETPTDTNANPKSKVEGVADAPEASHIPAPRQPQVTFESGTKGENVGADASTAEKISQEQSISAEARGAPLTVKPPTDAIRAPDGLSSPGSTAQSATTPAVHDDASTDTSPEHEGPQFVEPAEEKQTGDEGDDGEKEKEDARNARDHARVSSSEDLQNRVLEAPPDSAEAQLQESIRSSVAAEAAATAASNSHQTESVTSAPVPEDVVMSGTDHVITTPTAPDVNEAKETKTQHKSAVDTAPIQTGLPSDELPGNKEIPDSQEEPAEQMDVDIHEPKATVQTQSQEVKSDARTEASDKAPSTPAPAPVSDSNIVPVESVKESPQKAERAVTRVSSGAMRPKSVSEIVGETPRQTPTLEHTSTNKSLDNQLTPLTSTPKSPSLRHRHISAHQRQRSRSQPSTVVFGKPPKKVEEKTIVASQRDPIIPTEDYYTPLFVQGFAGSSSWMQPIEKILYTANKTVTTPDANLAIQDHQACKVLRRVYHLQQHDKWSLRQPKRCPEPTRPPSHWDVMLQEMKWMRTDFREERKWKRAVAKNLAYACAEWHESTPEERKLMQVPAVIPPKTWPLPDVSMADVEGENQLTPDLISSGDVESIDNLDDLTEDFPETIAPSAIFSLQDDDVIFGLRRTAAADQLLEELPMFGKPLQVPKFDLTGPEWDPDAHWRRPALPLSKYVEGHMKLVSDGPPRKRSRYDYQNEDSDDESEAGFVSSDPSPSLPLPPTTDEVALFNPEMKHIRDRLYVGHQFRPPSEYPMPSQSFFECRSPSQWTINEDDELRNLVREYSYNWSLIASMLTPRSRFTSGAERRSPWECFERWIALEGLPADMSKTQYFKAYTGRIAAAQNVIAQQNQLVAQQVNQANGAVAPGRRRPASTPVRVERRRNQKHLTLLDAMRKLAKKRETAAQKQQHTASQNAANKKVSDPASQRPNKTPREYSILRYERDQALAEKMAQYASRQEAQRRVSTTHRNGDTMLTPSEAALQARAQGQAAQMAGTPGAAQVGQNSAQAAAAAAAAVAAANGMNGVGRVNVPNQLAAAAAVAGQARPRMPMQSPVANGMGGVPSQMAGGLVPPNQMTSAQQAQLQAMQGQHNRMPMPNPQPDVNLMMRAQRISEQQRLAQMQHAQGGPGTPGQGATGSQQSPPPNMRNGVNNINGANPMNQQSFLNNAQAMMAQFSSGNLGSPQANGLHMPAGPAGSIAPRPQAQLPASIAAQLVQLEAQFRTKHPNLPPDQIRQLATEHLTRLMMAQRTAMNSAAGTANGQGGLAASIAATTSPHQYAALLRQQQQQQASQAAGSPGQQHQQLHQQHQQAQHQPQQQQAKQQQPQQQQQQAQAQAQVQAQHQAQQQRQASGSATPSAG
ncbi:chromatin modification- protein VID21 [Fusarium sp. DS 682]|nr:chromatin modification- protein VID21 [Fusarium sp. DS 682]